MNDQQREEVLQDAIDTWGANAQLDMTTEETGELIAELGRYWRGRSDEEDLAEEVADVRIMLDQLALMLDGRVEEWEEKKLERLEDRLNGSNDHD